MTDYTELIEALRCCPTELNCAVCPYNIMDGNCNYVKMLSDAADAIEELQAEVYEKDCFIGMLKVQMDNMDKQIPKHGEWTTYNARNNLYECSLCHYVSIAGKTNHCPKCGAKMEDRR